MKTLSLTIFFLTMLFCITGFTQVYTAEQLYKEKRNNSDAFDKKYFNQTFTVTGKIWNITPCTAELPGFKNYHKIALTGTGYEMFIVCQIPFAQKEVLNEFQPGQVVTVKGMYNDKSLSYVLLNNCTFSAAKEEKQGKKTTAQIPLGLYSVYQQGGAGFAFQYQFTLKSYTSYTMNGKNGTVSYDRKTAIIHFNTGLLKGFAGVYRPANPTNQADPPTIILDSKGKITNPESTGAAFQFAYFKG